MFEKLNVMAQGAYVKGRAVLQRAADRFALACRRVSAAETFEEGQGFTEYIIIIAGVLLIGAAIFVLFRTIRNKYEQANSAVESLPVEGGW